MRIFFHFLFFPCSSSTIISYFVERETKANTLKEFEKL